MERQTGMLKVTQFANPGTKLNYSESHSYGLTSNSVTLNQGAAAAKHY